MADLSWAHVLRDTDRALYKRCRRAWDFGGWSRRNLEPIAPLAFDLDRAVHDALAVYYFPGMWEWNRSIVRPLANEAFHKSMRSQRAAFELLRPLAAEEEVAWEEGVARGTLMLDRYYEWAPAVDWFTPVRVETDFEVDLPDPAQAENDLVATDGRPIRFRGRIEMLAVDEDDVYWLVDHRMAESDWEDLDLLVLDEAGVAACWAWEHFFIGMRIAGILYNELRISPPAGVSPARPVADAGAPRRGATGHRRMYVQPAREPDPRITQVENQGFRRTKIPRSRHELDHVAGQLVAEALEMTDAAVALYPHPTRANCGSCAYRRPCIAMNEVGDYDRILTIDYRPRGDELEEGRLGGVTWSMNRGAAPPKFGGSR